MASYPSGEYADHVAPQIFPLWGENDLFFSSSFVTFSFPLSINLLFLLLCSRGRALHAVSTVQYITVSFERPKTEVRNLSFFPNFPFLCAMGPKAELPTPFLPSCLSRSKRTVKETERWEGEKRDGNRYRYSAKYISAFLCNIFIQPSPHFCHRRPCSQVDGMAPTFDKKPTIRHAEGDGSTLVFHCSIMAEPKPMISWYNQIQSLINLPRIIKYICPTGSEMASRCRTARSSRW